MNRQVRTLRLILTAIPATMTRGQDGQPKPPSEQTGTLVTPLHRFFLFGGAALVTVTGFLGGALVHGLDHYLLR